MCIFQTTNWWIVVVVCCLTHSYNLFFWFLIMMINTWPLFIYISHKFLSLYSFNNNKKTNNWSTNALIIWPLFYFFCWKFYFGYILQGLVFDYICRTFESFFQFFFWIIVLLFVGQIYSTVCGQNIAWCVYLFVWTDHVFSIWFRVVVIQLFVPNQFILSI